MSGLGRDELLGAPRRYCGLADSCRANRSSGHMDRLPTPRRSRARGLGAEPTAPRRWARRWRNDRAATGCWLPTCRRAERGAPEVMVPVTEPANGQRSGARTHKTHATLSGIRSLVGIDPWANGFPKSRSTQQSEGSGFRSHSLGRTLRGRIPARRSIAAARASWRPSVRSPTGSGLARISWWRGSRATAR